MHRGMAGAAGPDGAADAAAAAVSVAVPASSVAATATSVTWRREANLGSFMGRTPSRAVLLTRMTPHDADRLGQNCPRGARLVRFKGDVRQGTMVLILRCVADQPRLRMIDRLLRGGG